MKEIIETVVITPKKETPWEIFKKFHRLAYFMETMDRTSDGRVIWDDEVQEIYSEEMAQAEYMGLQHGWFSVNMEVPKKVIEGADPQLKFDFNV